MNLEDFQAQFDEITQRARYSVGGDTFIELNDNLNLFDSCMEEMYNLCLKALGEL